MTHILNSGPIGFGNPTLGNIATSGQLDVWTFFARAGQLYTVLLDPGSGSGTPPYLGYAEVKVLNTNGAVMTSATNATGGTPILLSSVAITSDGTYSIQVHASPVAPSGTGHYMLTVWQTTPNVQSLPLGQIVSGSIQTPYSAMPAGISLDWVQYGRGGANINDSSIVWSLGNMNTNVAASMNVTADTVANGTWDNFFTVADSDGAAAASAVQLLYVGVTPPVLLKIALTNNQVVLSWPASAGNFGLQMATNLLSQANWATVTNNSATNGSNVSVTLPVTGTNRFFRLRSQ